MHPNTRFLAVVLALAAFSPVPPALAVNLTAASVTPEVVFDDTDGTIDEFDFSIAASVASEASGAWFVRDELSDNFHHIIELQSVGTTGNENSMVVQGNGDIRWANGLMYFEKLGGELAIGTTLTPSDLTLSSAIPDIRLTDETDSSEVDLQLNAGLLEITGKPSAGSFRSILSLGVDAPANSLVIDPAGNVGFGTATPDQAVAVQRSAAAARFQLTSFTNNAAEAPQYIQRRARGTAAAPASILNGDNLGLFSFRGYTPAGFGGSRATITAQAAGNFTNASTPTRIIFATTPAGQTNPQQVLEITENGQVRVNGLALNVPDYVFADDYALMPLEELQAFIDENGHLPGIPSADEVNSEGLDLAGSQMSQLQKIEELTLYTLQQQQRIEHLEAQLARVLTQLAQD